MSTPKIIMFMKAYIRDLLYLGFILHTLRTINDESRRNEKLTKEAIDYVLACKVKRYDSD